VREKSLRGRKYQEDEENCTMKNFVNILPRNVVRMIKSRKMSFKPRAA
jgi:hypothetical protein